MTQRPFSKKWVGISMLVFIAVELFLGGFVAQLLVGKFISIGLRFTLQGGLYLISFFIGGFIIGLISPGIRIAEPAVGAFLSVAFMLFVSIFTPYSFIRFSLTRMLIGGVVAFFLALWGARTGERLMGNRGRKPRAY